MIEFCVDERIEAAKQISNSHLVLAPTTLRQLNIPTPSWP